MSGLGRDSRKGAAVNPNVSLDAIGRESCKNRFVKETEVTKTKLPPNFKFLGVEHEQLAWSLMFSPAKPPYNGGAFRIKIVFPAEFPFSPPKIRFVNKILHPCVDESGTVSLLMLTPGNWKPASRMFQVLTRLASVIENFEIDQPLRLDLVDLLNRDDESAFCRKAAEFTKAYAEKRS